MKILGYDSSAIVSLTVDQLEAWRRQNGTRLWLHANGAGAAELEQIGAIFGFSRPNLDDCRQAKAQNSVEAYNRYLFVTLPHFHLRQGEPAAGQLCLFVGHNFVVSVQSETETESTTAVDELWFRYENEMQLWQQGPDYLLYRLTRLLAEASEAAVAPYDESHLPASESSTINELAGALFTWRRQVIQLAYHVSRQAEVIGHLIQLEHELLDANIRYYMRYSYSQLTALAGQLHLWRDLADNAIEATAQRQAAHMNQSLRHLTLTIAIMVAILTLAFIMLLLLRLTAVG
jgi:magnesium transporter